MTRRDYWLGVLLLALAILAQGLLPRYEWRIAGDPTGIQQLIRVDNWTGGAQMVNPQAAP